MKNKSQGYITVETEQKTVFEGEVEPNQARYKLAKTAIKYAQKFQVQKIVNELASGVCQAN